MVKDSVATKQMKNMKVLLIKNIKIILADTSYSLYKKIKDLYDISKRLNPKYTFREMSLELDFNEQKIYKLLEFRNANNRTISLVNDGKITFHRVVRFFAIYGKGKKDDTVQNTCIDLIIEKNMTIPEMEKHFQKKNQAKAEETLHEARKYKNTGNIARDIKIYIGKLQKSLLSLERISENKKVETIESLANLSIEIRKVIKRIQKNE